MLRATKGKVIVRPPKAVETMQGDILLPAAKKVFHDSGEVIAVGAEVEGVAVGEEVLFREGAGIKVRYDGEELLAVRADELYAVAGA